MRGDLALKVALFTSAVVAAIVCFLGLFSPSPAPAGTFTVVSCHDAAGNAVGTRGWGVAASNGQYITFGSSCAAAGQGVFGLTMGSDPTSEYFNGDGDTMTYTVPAGLTILAYSLELHAFGGPCVVQDGQCANGFGQVWVDHTGQSDPNYDYRNLGYGTVTTTVAASELSGVHDVSVGVGCDPGQDLRYPCSGKADPEAQALVSGGSFTLLDSTVPSVSNVSGSLITGGVLTGTDTISFTGVDSGGGVYSATVLVDGRQVVHEVPDSNDGLCVNLAPAGSATMTFASSQPCRTTKNISIPLDTTRLSAGQHHLLVRIEDVAGEEATAYDGTITVGGQSPVSAAGGRIGPGSPLALRGATNGTDASDQAKLTAGWSRTSKATLTGRYGARERITGRLRSSAGGQPIASAALDVHMTLAYQGARTQRLSSVRTGAAGGWSVTLPADIPSCALDLAYRSHVNDTVAVATKVLRLRVHAGLMLHVAPRTASVGHRIFFSGRVRGAPIPRGGKQLVLEASSGGEWVQFDTINTDAKGRYRASYRFKFPGPVTYRFRVRSPAEADFPFLAGSSNVVVVREL